MSLIKDAWYVSCVKNMHFGSPSDTCCQGVAKVRILNFKTTWSEFQKASQTATKRGNAELRILDFKTTWSEFQKPCQTAAKQGKAELRILDSKTTMVRVQEAQSDRC